MSAPKTTEVEEQEATAKAKADAAARQKTKSGQVEEAKKRPRQPFRQLRTKSLRKAGNSSRPAPSPEFHDDAVKEAKAEAKEKADPAKK
jgi:hypothetical protein